MIWLANGLLRIEELLTLRAVNTVNCAEIEDPFSEGALEVRRKESVRLGRLMAIRVAFPSMDPAVKMRLLEELPELSTETE